MNDIIIGENQNINSSKLANKIIRLIGELHQRGFESLYLDSGMSPSGLHWRYHILTNEKSLISGSLVGDFPKFDWVSDWDASIESWADNFIQFYQDNLQGASQKNNTYVKWFEEVIQIVGVTGYLVLYDDCGSNPYCYVDGKSINLQDSPTTQI